MTKFDARLVVRLPRESLHRLEKAADLHLTTASDLVRRMIAEFLHSDRALAAAERPPKPAPSSERKKGELTREERVARQARIFKAQGVAPSQAAAVLADYDPPDYIADVLRAMGCAPSAADIPRPSGALVVIDPDIEERVEELVLQCFGLDGLEIEGLLAGAPVAVREAVLRKLGISPKPTVEPFNWGEVPDEFLDSLDDTC